MPNSDYSDAIVREARLLEVGDYPDKGVTITEQDLSVIAESSGEVPLIVEHKPSLVLGIVRNLMRRGKELWGEVVLERDANSVIERNGLRGLSVGLARNLKRILEVSLTARPRVASAQLFSAERAEAEHATPDIYITAQTEQTEQGGIDVTITQTAKADTTALTTQTVPSATTPSADTTALSGSSDTATAEQVATPAPDFYALRIAELERRLDEATRQAQVAQDLLFTQSVEAQLDRWIREGRIPPAAKPKLVTLIQALPRPATAIQFDAQSDSYRALIEFVESLPKQALRQAVQFASPHDSLDTYRQELKQAGIGEGLLSDEIVSLYAQLKAKNGEVPEL